MSERHFSWSSLGTLPTNDDTQGTQANENPTSIASGLITRHALASPESKPKLPTSFAFRF